MIIPNTFKKLHPLFVPEIMLFCKKNNIPLISVFMRNEPIPKIPNSNCAYVINIDDFNGPGTHYTAFIVKNGKGYYFDSFGMAPPKEILSLIKQSKIEFYRNDNVIQGEKSIVCGYLVCDFLYNMFNKNIDFYDFVYHYYSNNYGEVDNLIKKKFKIKS